MAGHSLRRFARATIGVALLVIWFPAELSGRESQKLSDQEIRRLLIERAIANYPGNCPCPYNSARNGSRCGGRSAWSKKGGYAPLCYEEDVTDAMVKEFRKTQGR